MYGKLGVVMANAKQYNRWIWFGTVLWMLVIFMLSAQVATTSSALSHSVSERVVQVIKTVAPPVEITAESINHWVRKYAHFFAYSVLGLLLCLTKISKRHVVLIGILYAISDEWHQAFVPGRGPSIKDVFIDTSGIMCGMCLYYIVHKVFHKLRG
jgi:VanZ family protein